MSECLRVFQHEKICITDDLGSHCTLERERGIGKGDNNPKKTGHNQEPRSLSTYGGKVLTWIPFHKQHFHNCLHLTKQWSDDIRNVRGKGRSDGVWLVNYSQAGLEGIWYGYLRAWPWPVSQGPLAQLFPAKAPLTWVVPHCLFLQPLSQP